MEITNMLRSTGRLLFKRGSLTLALFGVGTLAFLALGCGTESVGDPCIPESIPADGFNPAETYIETSSVQCRTRVCMVYQLDGNPEHVGANCPPGATTCVTEEEVDERVYCTCRCDSDSANTPLCACPEGFSCEEILNSGGAGVRGSYCVRRSTVSMSM